jgi:iron complex transport system substrate-binding protein
MPRPMKLSFSPQRQRLQAWRGSVAASLWATLLLLALPVAHAQSVGANGAISVVDDRGVKLTFPHAPRRIVSLLPSLTETVCALGECARLIGVDRYSNWPQRANALPRVGGGLDPNIEAIVALKPDLVLAATSAKAAMRLNALGIPVLAFEPKTLTDVKRVWGELGLLLGVAHADRDWTTMMSQLQQVASEAPHGPASTSGTLSVYFEVNQGPYAASESSFIGELLTRMQVRNIVPGALGPYPKLNPEFIVRAKPDLIMIGVAEVAGLASRPGWSTIPAIQTRQICAFTPAEGDVLVRAGPRMVEAARLIKHCLSRVSKFAPAKESAKK